MPVIDKVMWTPVILPSLGFFYTGRCPGGKVEITPWTTVQEEMFVRYSGVNPTEMISKLVAGNLRLPSGMKQEELLITDRFFLLFQLRAISLVQQYTFTHTCPGCKLEHPVSISINNLDVKTPDEASDAEPFEVLLPRCQKTVALRLLRIMDELKMMEYEANVLKNFQDPGSPGHRFRISRQIEKIDGETPKFDEKMEFVKNLVWHDLQIIRRTLEKHETGLILSLETQCPRCPFKDKWDLPFQDSFFRPRDVDFEPASGVVANDRAGDQLPSE
jgi:hypothetical protein